MPLATRSMNNPAILEAHEPLAARMARSVVAVSSEDLTAEVTRQGEVVPGRSDRLRF